MIKVRRFLGLALIPTGMVLFLGSKWILASPIVFAWLGWSTFWTGMAFVIYRWWSSIVWFLGVFYTYNWVYLLLTPYKSPLGWFDPSLKVKRPSIILALISGAPLIAAFYYLNQSGVPVALKNLSQIFRLKKIKDTIVSFILFYLFTVFFFTLCYATVNKVKPRSFQPSEDLSLFDFTHYSVVTISTLGYGDIKPVHWTARLLSMAEVLFGIGLIVIYVGVAIAVLLKEKK